VVPRAAATNSLAVLSSAFQGYTAKFQSLHSAKVAMGKIYLFFLKRIFCQYIASGFEDAQQNLGICFIQSFIQVAAVLLQINPLAFPIPLYFHNARI
jgi:hypothetical protein